MTPSSPLEVRSRSGRVPPRTTAGQILYRIAEMLEGRRAEFVEEVRDADEVRTRTAEKVVDAAIDRWVWYAGWSDKIAQVHGSSNPVAGPFFDFSVPEPTGVVAVIAPQQSSLLGLVSVLAPVIVSGNTAVVVAAERGRIPAISLTEVLATSDLPAGVVNMLTGRADELAPWLASHMDVNAIDLCGATPGGGRRSRACRRGQPQAGRAARPRREPDWLRDPGLDRMLAFLETKTVWHPIGV